jgi:acetolactate synthase-1/3 small subunit
MKQLNKVVEVLKVVDLTETHFLDRETALIKVHTKPEHRDEAIRLAEIFRAKIVDSSANTYTIEITGDVDKVEAMINMLKPLASKIWSVPVASRSPAKLRGPPHHGVSPLC